jgi:hypothetical protein
MAKTKELSKDARDKQLGEKVTTVSEIIQSRASGDRTWSRASGDV